MVFVQIAFDLASSGISAQKHVGMRIWYVVVNAFGLKYIFSNANKLY